MKILSKQKNSRMCMICGLDNEYGVNAPFYNMEDGSVMTDVSATKNSIRVIPDVCMAA